MTSTTTIDPMFMRLTAVFVGAAILLSLAALIVASQRVFRTPATTTPAAPAPMPAPWPAAIPPFRREADPCDPAWRELEMDPDGDDDDDDDDSGELVAIGFALFTPAEVDSLVEAHKRWMAGAA